MSASRLHSKIQRNFLRMHPGSALTMIDRSIRDYEVAMLYVLVLSHIIGPFRKMRYLIR